MKIRHTTSGSNESDKIKLNMTSMIDIVFQLLVFFIMSLRIVAQEGDFNVKMPLGNTNGAPTEVGPECQLIIRLTADDRGQLKDILIHGRSLGTSFSALNNEIIDAVGPPAPDVEESSEVELSFDRKLHYHYVVQAMTAISGYVKDGKSVKLINTIKFSRR